MTDEPDNTSDLTQDLTAVEMLRLVLADVRDIKPGLARSKRSSKTGLKTRVDHQPAHGANRGRAEGRRGQARQDRAAVARDDAGCHGRPDRSAAHRGPHGRTGAEAELSDERDDTGGAETLEERR